MRQRVLATLALLLLALPNAAQQQALTAADHTAIQTIIERQLEAFRNDDAAGALAFASPAIREKFGTPEQFMAMVQTAYQPVYRPRYVAFKELRMVEGVPTQTVLLVGPDGVPVLALYMMQKQPDGAWKIDGCYLMSFKDERL
jgi:ketosteroid isomerase-like protein